ncbi:MAG: vanadium-dependent haloperoxidase, partial [Fimbriimonas ginsengisoli]|nr:vanadium-dependent haloperoxidase [Fimbriimonas ginsengisoli]
KMFFLVGNALMDAGITCWDSKRAYDSSRPWTAVHDLFVGQVILGWGGSGVGTVPMLGENWRPYQPLSFITPPFPEHVSGHSTFSAAAAEVLKGFTGSDAFGGSLLVPAGAITYDAGAPSVDVLLSWPTFTDAAEQAGMSRLFGGIHYMAANLEGQALGRQVGQAVLAKAELYFNFHNQLP